MSQRQAALLAHANTASQAWTSVLHLFDPWCDSSASNPATVPSPTALPSDANVLRQAISCLFSLQLDHLLIDHILHEIVVPWVENKLVSRWWATLDPFLQLQQQLFNTPRAPRQFHPKLNQWLLQAVEQAVREAHQSMQPLLDRLALIDFFLLTSSVLTPSSVTPLLLVPRFRRAVRTAFEASLSRSCTVSATPMITVRRGEMFQELLFKFFRLNFRAFHRCALAREENQRNTAGNDGTMMDEDQDHIDKSIPHVQSVDDTVEAHEEDGTNESGIMADVNTSMASTSSQSKRQPSSSNRLMHDCETMLTRFVWICKTLKELHFVGSSPDEKQAFYSSSAVLSNTSPHTPSSLSFPPSYSSIISAGRQAGSNLDVPSISSWITPEYFLDFFFILMEKFIRHTCLGMWETDQLQQVHVWIKQRIEPFLFIILMGEFQPGSILYEKQSHGTTEHLLSSANNSRYAAFLHCNSRLSFYCMECFGLIRIREELFDMIKDYPDSLPGLKNLAELLKITKQHALLTKHLSETIIARLLQPATNTKSILQQYANIIACSRILDPQGNHSLLGGILDLSKIGSYVKSRPDAVRCVVRAVWGSMDERKALEEEDEELERRAMEALEEADVGQDSNMADEEEAKNAESAVDTTSSAMTGPAVTAPSAPAEESEPIGLDLVNELETAPDATQFGDDSDAEDNGALAGAGAEQDSGAGGSASSISGSSGHDAWHPDPLTGEGYSSISASARYLRKADVLSLLIDLCGNGERNEELLLVDYKNFLSARLLAKKSQPVTQKASSSGAQLSVTTQENKDPLYDTETEVTHVELMKLRFGEVNPSLNDVEVMLKDVIQSKRIHAQLSAASKKPPPAARAHPIKNKDGKPLSSSVLQHTIEVRAAGKQPRQEDEEDEEEVLVPVLPEVAASPLAVQQALHLAPSFNALILSSEFWPPLVGGPCGEMGLSSNDEEFDFQLPGFMQAVLDGYSQGFHTLKTPRQLEWIPSAPASRGNVCVIEISLEDGRVENVECEPVHVAILEKFATESDIGTGEGDQTFIPGSTNVVSSVSSTSSTTSVAKTEWLFSELLEALGMDEEEILTSKLAFWVSKGILRLVPNGENEDDPKYQLIEHASSSDEGDEEEGSFAAGGDAAGSGGMSEKQRREFEAQVESYVMGSLGNFAALSVTKLHNMLKTISASVGGFLYTTGESELKIYLSTMEEKGLIECKDGLYTKTKSRP